MAVAIYVCQYRRPALLRNMRPPAVIMGLPSLLLPVSAKESRAKTDQRKKQGKADGKMKRGCPPWPSLLAFPLLLMGTRLPSLPSPPPGYSAPPPSFAPTPLVIPSRADSVSGWPTWVSLRRPAPPGLLFPHWVASQSREPAEASTQPPSRRFATVLFFALSKYYT